ncbi:MAG: ATP-binding protein [Oscillatoriaceae bacterium SKW80]|nr:ATP-binding protein [Oscillatoriaceae bacterium SKYG93]MCX8119793.1 ATP-binding protein [Oscillatoriaceae bacterium SKW80]MDW8452103.1 DICT sensory domain-containing protein [Oscillatoriaceae cyanobacterium SKYGB_i_bin93]HIK27460.1 histidine kinase [Oscillatoriaceae cyanobacterium M7585_C2015_266]
MNPPSAEEVSLYELAISSLQPPVPLQVSLPTFKSMVKSALELLTEQNLPATLLLKLPHSMAWQDCIQRYRQLGKNEGIYVCLPASADAESESNQEVSELEKESLPLEKPISSALQLSRERKNQGKHNQSAYYERESLRNFRERESNQQERVSPIFGFGLGAKEFLRQEYFLLVLSQNLCCAIIAHRPRSVRIPVEMEVGGERLHPLLALCLVDKPTIAWVLEGLKKALAFSLASGNKSNEIVKGSDLETLELLPVATEELLANWDYLFTRYLTSDASSAKDTMHWAGLLWAKQIQQQEEVWRTALHYRKKAAEAEKLQVQNEKLVEALHLKDEFICNLGQALRMPLTNMKTALSLLGSQNLKAAQRERYLHLLNTECERQTSLINGMLDLVRLDSVGESAPLQSLHLADIVPGVVSTYQPLAQEKGIILAYTLPDNLPPVACLRPWLKQIVINLLHNSIKFTKSGGQVWVRGKQQGDYVQLEFRDTGIGIPASEIPKIFDRFYRVRHSLEEDPGGAGLGLSIVQQLLLRCGGSISVHSKLGEGSTFNVLLPIYRNSSAE